MAQSVGDTVTVRGEAWQITGMQNCSHLGSKFFGKIAFDLRRVSDGATSRYVGKRVTAQCSLSVTEPERSAEPETCDHVTGQPGCALPTCQGVPVGVDVSHASEPVADMPDARESGSASFGRDMVWSVRNHGLIVSMPTLFASAVRPDTRFVHGWTFTANGHSVTVMMYESRGPLDRYPRNYSAVWVGGQLVSSEQPMTGGAAAVGSAVGYAVARHVETLPAVPVAPAEVAAPEVAEPVADVAAPAVPVAEVPDFSGAVDLAEVPAEIGAEVANVPAVPVTVTAEPLRRGYNRRVIRRVTNRRAGACDWCGLIVPAGRGEARLLDVDGWVVVHPSREWQGSPVSGGYVGGCPEVHGPEVPPKVDAAEVDRAEVAADMWLRANMARDGGQFADALTMIDAGEDYAPDFAVPHYGTWSAMRDSVQAAERDAAEPEPVTVPEVPAKPEPVRTPVAATVDRDTLADALTFVGKSVPKRPNVPVMSGVLLTVDGGRFTVSAFDLDDARTVHVPADDVADGRTVVGYRSLADVVKKLPKRARVSLAEVGGTLTVECGQVRLSLPTMPAEDYPPLPPMPDRVGALPVQVFADMAVPVAVSAGTDETLPKLTGVRVEATGVTLAMLSTDRYRLGIRETAWAGEDFGALVPARTLAEVAKRYAKVKGATVTVGCEWNGTAGRFAMVCDRYTVNVRTLDDGSDYLPVRSLVPAESAFVASATVDAAAMLGAVERAAMACERTQPVRLTFADGQVTVAGGSADAGEVSEPVACEWSGGELGIAFNPAYLADGVRAAGTGRVRLRFVAHNRAALIVPAGEGVFGPADVYLIMPISGRHGEGGFGSWTPPARPETAEPVAAEVPAAEPVTGDVPEVAADVAEPAEVAAGPVRPVGVDVDRACRSLTQRARRAANVRGSDRVSVRYSAETGRVSVKGAQPSADMVSAAFGRAYRFDRAESPAFGGFYAYYLPVAAEPAEVSSPAEVPADAATGAEPAAEVPAEPVAADVVAEPVPVAEVAETVAPAEPEPGADIMARVLDAYAAGDLAGALAGVVEGETVAPDYREAGESGAVYGWAELRAALPAEPETVAEPVAVADVAEPVAAEVVGMTAGPVADVTPEVPAELKPVPVPAADVADVVAEPVPVRVPSAVDVHAAILAQLGGAGSLTPTVPAPVPVVVPDTVAEVAEVWAADDMPVPVSPAPVAAGGGAEPERLPLAIAGDVARVGYAPGTAIKSLLKVVRPEVLRRTRDAGLKSARCSIVPDRESREVTVTLEGADGPDAVAVWRIVAEVMAVHGFRAVAEAVPVG